MKMNKLIYGLIAFWLFGSLCLAQSYKVVTVPSPGGLKTSLGDEWNEIDSVVVKGMINKDDFKTLYDCSRLGKLSVINLEQANVEGNKIPDEAFNHPELLEGYLPVDRIILPDNIEEIGKYAFKDMYLKQINFPASLKKFSIGSFIGCHWMNVDPLVIPEGVTKIPSICFAHCQSFDKLVLPQSLKIIDVSSFYNTRIKEVNFPEGLDSIGEGAFWGATGLRRVVIPENTVKLGEGAFAWNDSLESIKLPQGIFEIPALFLAYNNRIDSINIPDNVTRIGENAFQMDYNLGYIRLPNYLKSIGLYAFEATNITETILPETLEFIGRCAFFDLEHLEKVYCMAKNPPTAELDPENFNYGPFHWSFPGRYTTLYVPVGSGNLYRAAEGWQDFDQIVETENFPSDCAIIFATECKVSAYGGAIHVNNPTGKVVDIIVYDTYGRIITQEKAGETFNLDVAAGIYLVRMGNKTEKVLVR